MVELVNHEKLLFSFPELHRDAECEISFLQTERVNPTTRLHKLPNTRHCYPLGHVQDYADRVPSSWLRQGGALLAIKPEDAVQIIFHSPHKYPFAIKVACGKKCAISGESWTEHLVRGTSVDSRGNEKLIQNYLCVPPQNILAGFQVSTEEVRQFVAQDVKRNGTSDAISVGGLQIQVFPIKPEIYERRLEEKRQKDKEWPRVLYHITLIPEVELSDGGRITQHIFSDSADSVKDYCFIDKSRVFIHLANLDVDCL